MSFIKVEYKQDEKRISVCGMPIYRKKRTNSNFSEQLDYLRYIILPALQQHPKTFGKYKNIYKGKDVVLVATGPTLKHYLPIKNAVHVGVNSAFAYDKVQLDYLFIQDRYPTIYSKGDEVAKYPCHKFFGMHYIQPETEQSSCITEDDVERNNAERYYFLAEGLVPKSFDLFSADITTRPLHAWESTSFCALDFILWTHPKRVFLVGCDNTGFVHFDNFTDGYKRAFSDNNKVKNHLFSGWNIFKSYASMHYPETEIILVNPVGLKGMFKDVYTNSYLQQNPKIGHDNIELLGE